MMKVGIIGANGNLGSRITKQALERGYDVKGFIYSGDMDDTRVEIIKKSLFDLTKADIEDIDVLVSAFGGGFKVNPVINQEAFEKYLELLTQGNKKLITIAGAGSLYTDSSHTQYEYQSDTHPEKLKNISKYIRLGVDELQKDKSFDWIIVCPSRFFDLKGPFTGHYIVGDNEEIITNDDHESYVTYDDLAKAMVDFIESKQYNHQIVTIATQSVKEVKS